MTARRMLSGPISSTDTLLAKAARAGSDRVGGMPGSLDPRGVTGSAAWFLDGESYVSGRRQRWTLDTGVGRVALVLFDDSASPGWELDIVYPPGAGPARLEVARGRLSGGAVVALAVALGLAWWAWK